MKNLQLIALCTTALTMSAIPTTPNIQTNANDRSVNLKLGEVYHLEVSGGYQMVIKNGAPNIKISGTKHALDRLNLIEQDDKLILQPHKKISNWFSNLFNWSNTDSVDYQLKITLTLPLLYQLDLYGNSSVTVAQNVGIQESNLYGASSLSIGYPQTGLDPRFNLRGSSKLIATSLSAKSLNIKLDNQSSAHIGSISTSQEARIEINDKSRLSAKNIKSAKLNISSYGKSRSSIDTANSKFTELSLYSSASQFFKNLKTDQLLAETSGSSVLTIDSGSASFARTQQRRNGKFSFLENFKIAELAQQ